MQLQAQLGAASNQADQAKREVDFEKKQLLAEQKKLERAKQKMEALSQQDQRDRAKRMTLLDSEKDKMSEVGKNESLSPCLFFSALC